jgi:hypothetical protein
MMAHRFGIGTLDDLVPTPGGRRSPGEGAGTGPVPLCCSAFELAQHKSEESMGILVCRAQQVQERLLTRTIPGEWRCTHDGHNYQVPARQTSSQTRNQPRGARRPNWPRRNT